jgi:hypothetical protein
VRGATISVRREEVSAVTTAELIERSKRFWVPAAPSHNAVSSVYVGRHRRSAPRRLGLLRMFYLGRHRSR